jgi:hypothetical protein
MHQTNVDRALAALEEKYADDPERSTLVRLTRRFKASWLELAEALSEVKRGKQWERWGYDSFEAYFKGELKLQEATVEKLTGSYMFLHKRAPQVLTRDPLDAPLPSYQAIDFLRRAEERAAEKDSTVSGETMDDIRKKVLDEGTPIATVARLYKDTLFPVPEAQKKEKDRAAIKSAATKLRDLLGETTVVPKGLAKSVSSSLDELLSELGSSAKAA